MLRQVLGVVGVVGVDDDDGGRGGIFFAFKAVFEPFASVLCPRDLSGHHG